MFGPWDVLAVRGVLVFWISDDFRRHEEKHWDDGSMVEAATVFNRSAVAILLLRMASIQPSMKNNNTEQNDAGNPYHLGSSRDSDVCFAVHGFHRFGRFDRDT